MIDLGKNIYNLDVSKPLDSYSGVLLTVGTDDSGNELSYFVGDKTKRVLYVTNPFGTELMARDILDRVRGYTYQPYYADGALLDPAAELSDEISANGTESIIYSRATTFGTLMASNISAPTNEEVIHEYNVQSPEERKFTRLEGETKANLKITATRIEGEISNAVTGLSSRITQTENELSTKVSNAHTGSNFGWSLSDTQWRVFDQNGDILTASSSGLKVKGRIEADEGYIGGENGFTIKASAIYNGISSFGGSGQSGVYLGTDGLQIGQNFKADSSGNITASSMQLYGGSIDIRANTNVPDITKDSVIYSDWIYVYESSITPSFRLVNGGTINAVTNFSIDNNIIPSSAYIITSTSLVFNSDWLESLSLGEHIIKGDIRSSHDGLVDYISFVSPTLNIYENEYFHVDTSGNVTATSLSILGGSINIGNNFRVDNQGNLYATTGTFEGNVYAKNITAGGDAGTFDGYGLTPYTVEGGVDGSMGIGTVDTDNVIDSINASLANGDYAANEIYDGFSSGMVINGTLVYRDRVVSWKQVRLADGSVAYAMCQ